MKQIIAYYNLYVCNIIAQISIIYMSKVAYKWFCNISNFAYMVCSITAFQPLLFNKALNLYLKDMSIPCVKFVEEELFW